jgi:hypothetical protein
MLNNDQHKKGENKRNNVLQQTEKKQHLFFVKFVSVTVENRHVYIYIYEIKNEKKKQRKEKNRVAFED